MIVMRGSYSVIEYFEKEKSLKKSLKKIRRYIVVLFLLVFFAGIWIPRLEYGSERSRLSEDILFSDGFR